jgi:hypothetical protein
MPQTYTPCIISSPAHLAQFADIKRQNPWWKMLLGLQKLPAGFPRVYVGNKPVQVVFFAKGELTLVEQQATFRAAAPGFDNGQRYEHINTAFGFDLPYSAITQVERYQAPDPFIKYFNFNWVRIIVDDPAAPNDLLLSLTGSGTQMQQLHRQNDALFADLQARVAR